MNAAYIAERRAQLERIGALLDDTVIAFRSGQDKIRRSERADEEANKARLDQR